MGLSQQKLERDSSIFAQKRWKYGHVFLYLSPRFLQVQRTLIWWPRTSPLSYSTTRSINCLLFKPCPDLCGRCCPGRKEYSCTYSGIAIDEKVMQNWKNKGFVNITCSASCTTESNWFVLSLFGESMSMRSRWTSSDRMQVWDYVSHVAWYRIDRRTWNMHGCTVKVKIVSMWKVAGGARIRNGRPYIIQSRYDHWTITRGPLNGLWDCFG